eukprot:807746-Amorphochlora_amoeboformis.AAC.1
MGAAIPTLAQTSPSPYPPQPFLGKYRRLKVQLQFLPQVSGSGARPNLIPDLSNNPSTSRSPYLGAALKLALTPTLIIVDTFELPVELLGIANYPSIRRVVKTTVRKPKFTERQSRGEIRGRDKDRHTYTHRSSRRALTWGSRSLKPLR